MAPSLDDFTVLSLIGRGGFGSCHKIRRKSDDKILVWKKIRYNAMDSYEMKSVTKEVSLLRKLDHPCILKYYGNINDKEKEIMYIITDYCEYGDLRKLISTIHSKKGKLQEEDVWKIFCQISLALEECHDQGIIHRDLKPENIFLSKNKDAILGDFGIARVLPGARAVAHTFCGTSYYMSPEILENRGHNEKTDVWSLGCLIYELCVLEPPFVPKRNENLLDLIYDDRIKPIPSCYSDRLDSVINRMLTIDAKKRPRIRDLVKSSSLASKFDKYDPFQNNNNQLLAAPSKPKAKSPSPLKKKGK